MIKRRPLLLLFDGNALVHRAYHAIPPLTVSKTGELVNAVYGFTNTLLKVLNEFNPDYIAVAFDGPAPTFRHHKFKDYKIQRPKAPPDLVKQLELTHKVVESFRLPSFEVEGYEADDVLGTLARQATHLGVDTIIATGDVDALQLVSPQVKVLAPGKTFRDTVVYDEATVFQKYGVTPEKISDFKALIGDLSDNIPGIPGIGKKTAAKLIQQFGGLEEIYFHIDKITPIKLKEILLAYKTQAYESRELTTIVTEAPVKLDLESCLVGGYDRKRVIELFRELEFYSLLRKLPEVTGKMSTEVKVKVMTPGNYRVGNTAEVMEELIVRLATTQIFAFDLETTTKGEIGAELVGLAIAPAPGEAYYLPLGHKGLEKPTQLPLPQVIARLKPFFEDKKFSKIAHNGKFDISVLAEYGVKLDNLIFDTMVAAYLLGEKSLGLKALAFNKLGIEMTPISELIGSGSKQISVAFIEVDKVAGYACADADATFRLKELLEVELRNHGLDRLFNEVEMPLIPVLVSMERNGVALDTELMRHLSQSLGQELLKLEKEIFNNVGHKFNINSPRQLAGVLYEELKLPKARKTKSGYSTEAAVLEELKGTCPVIPLILEYRQLAKLKSTYIDVLPGLINPKTRRVHTNFNQTATATGRLSSSEPNLQNIPVRGEFGKEIRRAFVAEPGNFLLCGDYSQIDLRVLAHLSQDANLIMAFLRDEDIHTATASQVFGVSKALVTPEMRRIAKTVNFGVIYGMSDYGLEQATEFNREEAAQFIAAYFEKYPGVKKFLEITKEQACKLGYVQTVMGRRRFIPEINSSNRQVREAAERMAINMPVQGTSADIIKIAMINLHKEMEKRGLKSKMILQVHDELLFEVPEGEVEEMKGLISEIMPKALELTVPLKVDIKLGKNWGEMK